MTHISLRPWLYLEMIIGTVYFLAIGLLIFRIRVVGRDRLGRWANVPMLSLHPVDILRMLSLLFVGRSDDLIIMNLARFSRLLILLYSGIFLWLWFQVS